MARKKFPNILVVICVLFSLIPIVKWAFFVVFILSFVFECACAENDITFDSEKFLSYKLSNFLFDTTYKNNKSTKASKKEKETNGNENNIIQL